jgi:hypothetical protein
MTHRVELTPGRWTRTVRLVAGIAGTAVLSACSMSSLVDVAPPTNAISPDAFNTPSAAMGLYGGAIKNLAHAYAGNGQGNDIYLSGLFSDELITTSSSAEEVDARSLDASVTSSANNTLYGLLQQWRQQANVAIPIMQRFPTQIPSALVGRVYAIEGYAELVLAERYCSGIPLTTLPPEGGALQYTRGFTTEEVLTLAVAHFDSALALTSDSTGYQSLAKVGKARALVDLGQYTQAAQAVQGVSPSFVYQVQYTNGTTGVDSNGVAATATRNALSNGEGVNGMLWTTPTPDPRVPVSGSAIPAKYLNGNTPVPLATGIEAQLIQAEADLSTHGTNWLTILNALRTTCTTAVGCPTPAPAGTGGVAGLPPLSDPGTDSLRVVMLFHERAFWLYLTGHRHGDLRRLVRQYHWAASGVFPAGVRTGLSFKAFGASVVFPIPDAERNNPLFHGCLDLNA